LFTVLLESDRFWKSTHDLHLVTVN